MDSKLLKKLGNIDQICGIRESRLIRGRGEGIEIAEFYNAAGMRFTVVPDRCMDLYDFSYKGINLAYHSQNGLTSPQAFAPGEGEFAEQWPGGLMVTCGLDNVGGQGFDGGNFPTHGRIGHVPASNFGTQTFWDGDNYVMKAIGEVHMTKTFARHLAISRKIETGLYDKSIRIHDVISNYDDADEVFQLLYHINFGYPLLSDKSIVKTCKSAIKPLNPMSTDPEHMMDPVDRRGEELFWYTDLDKTACGVLYNPELELGTFVRWQTENLPNFQEWKNMRSHDYVLAIEPCNTFGVNRDAARKEGRIAVLPAYSSIETDVEIGVLDGMQEINEFIKNI